VTLLLLSAGVRPHRCWNCGAPLPAGPADAVESCSFCGAETREEAPPEAAKAPSPRPSVPAPSPDASGAAGSKGRVVAFVLAPIVLALGIGGIVSAAGSCGSSSSSGASSTASPPSSSPKPKLNLGNLATAPSEFGWRALDPPAIVGSYSSFDPVANIAWAKSIGAAWKPDVILYRVDANRVAKDGRVAILVTPDALVRYRLESPKCSLDYKNSTALVDPQTQCELEIEVKASNGEAVVEVLMSKRGLDDAEVRTPACTLPQAFAALEAAGRLPPRPVYDADVLAIGTPALTPAVPYGQKVPANESPTDHYAAYWYVSTVIQGQVSIPQVDATTCKVGP
jgi:hypothetical protein